MSFSPNKESGGVVIETVAKPGLGALCMHGSMYVPVRQGCHDEDVRYPFAAMQYPKVSGSRDGQSSRRQQSCMKPV